MRMFVVISGLFLITSCAVQERSKEEPQVGSKVEANIETSAVTNAATSTANKQQLVSSTSNDSATSRRNDAHTSNSEIEDAFAIPGLDEIKLLEHVNLKKTVEHTLSSQPSTIEIRNDAGQFDVKHDSLEPFRSKDAASVKQVAFINFPLTDSEIEPLSETSATTLEVRNGQLKDLHALKKMKQLLAVNLSCNPLEHQAFEVLGTLTNLEHLSLDSTSVADHDLTFLYSLKRLKFLNLGDCKLSASAVTELRNRLPECSVQAKNKDSAPTGPELLDIAKAQKESGNIDDARQSAEKALYLLSAHREKDFRLVARCHTLLGDCFKARHQMARADMEYRKSASLFEKNSRNN